MQHLSPPPGNLSIIQKLISAYKLWHEFLPHITTNARHSLGVKIGSVFIETAELLYSASRSSQKEKLTLLEKASIKLDSLKFLLQIIWEIKALDNKKYILISEPLEEIGRMLGGWQKQIISQANRGERLL